MIGYSSSHGVRCPWALAWFMALLVLLLSGCSDGGSSGSDTASDSPDEETTQPLTAVSALDVDNHSHRLALWQDDNNHLTLLDLATDETTTLEQPFSAIAMAMDEGRGQILVADEDRQVHQLAQEDGTLQASAQALEYDIDRLLVDSDRGQIIAAGRQGQLTFLSTDTLVAETGPRLEGEQQALALWAEAGMLYVVHGEDDTHWLSAIDTSTRDVSDRVDLAGPVADVLLSPELGMLLLASDQAPGLRALDLPSLAEFATTELPVAPRQLALQSQTRTGVLLGADSTVISLLDLFELSLSSDFSDVESVGQGAISNRLNQLFVAAGDDRELKRIPLQSPKPQLDRVDPHVISVADEEVTLTLTGDHFIDGATLVVNEELSLPTQWIDYDRLEAIINPDEVAALGTASIRVHNPDPSDGPSDPRDLIIEGAEPQIDAISPTQGAGGDIVTVTGSRFAPTPSGNAVTIGGHAAVVASASSTELRVVVPLGTSGGVVQVQTDQGSAESEEHFSVRSRQAFDLGLSESNVRIPYAGQGSILISLTSRGLDDYDHPVKLSLEGLPEGVEAHLSHQRLSREQSVQITFSGEVEPGEYELTLIVEGESEEGPIRYEERLVLDVLPPDVTAVQGQIVNADTDQPMAGVHVRLGDQETTTDAAGEYLFLDPAETGEQVVIIDGDALNTDEIHYPSRIPMPVYVEEGRANRVLTSYIAPVEAEIYTEITSGQEASVTRDDIPGYELRIPDGATMTGWDDEPIDRINVRQVRPDRLPIRPLPEGVTTNSVYMYYFYRPGGAEPSEPIPVTMQNDLGLEPGDEAVMWYYDETPEADPDSNQWRVMGRGTVSDDGQQIVSNPGVGIPRFCCGASFATPDDPPETPPGGDGDACPGPRAGNPVDLASGSGSILDNHSLRVGGDPNLGVTVRYSSLSDRDGPFGTGTYADFEWRLDLGNAQATVTKPDGVRYNLVRGDDGHYRQQTGRRGGFGMEVRRDGGDAVLRRASGQQLRFGVGGQMDGLLMAVEDERGRTLARFQRDPDESAQVVTISDGQGRRYDLAYEDERVTRINCPVGREQRFEYDGSRLTRVTNFAGHDTTYDWETIEGRAQIVSKTNVEGHTTRYDYVIPPPPAEAPEGAAGEWSPQRVVGRIQQQELPDGSVYEFDYTPSWRDRINTTVVTHPNGAETRHTFNSDGYETRREDALGRVWQQSYNPINNFLEDRTDPLGRTTRFNHDNRGNVTAIRDPDGNLTEVSYHPRYNKPTRILDALGRETRFEYDSYGEVTAVTNGAGERHQLHRDGQGRLTGTTDPAGRTVNLAYDNYGNIRQITDPLGNTHYYQYDRAGRLLQETDALGRTTRYQYDELDRLTRMEDPAGRVTELEYTPGGTLQTVRDPKGAMIETNEFDERGRLILRTDALGGSHQNEYDAQGNLTRHLDPRGVETTLEYDAVNRLTEIRDGDGRTTTFTYDHVDRLVRVVDSEAGEYRYRYDNLDRLVREISDRGIIRYSYDAVGQMTERRVNEQEVTRYDYDQAGRVTRIEHDGQEARYEYDASGQLERKHLPNGMVQVYQRDSGGRVERIRYLTPGGSELDRIDYTMDATGTRTSQQQAAGRVVQDSPYEAEYDDANRLIAIDGHVLEYDANGNLIRRETDEGAVTFEWNARNQLVAIDAPDYQARFAYDFMGRRISREINGEQTQYLYHGLQAIAELDSSGSIQTSYHTGLMLDEVLARYSQTRDQTLLTDALGSVIALADEDGDITQRYAYSPFGETQSWGQSTGNPLQYTGRENDGTGLYYYRARYYSPDMNQFISPDPIGLRAGDPNFYRYVFGNPVNYYDPLGLSAMDYALQGGQVLGGAAQVLLGGAVCAGSGGIGCAGGALLGLKGIDNIQAGLRGEQSYSQRALISATGSENLGRTLDSSIDIGTSIYGLVRSVPRVNSLGNPMRDLFRRDPTNYEMYYNQATNLGLGVSVVENTSTLVDLSYHQLECR